MATSGEHEVRDEDRLPWLETVEDDYGDGGVPIVRIVLLVLLALVVLAGAIFGFQALRHRQATDGNGALIAAQEGDYKVKPDSPGGAKVDGEGDTAIATSNGTTGNASIDMAGPEAPVAAHKGPKPTPSPTGAVAVVTQIPAKAGTSGGSLVQLGSFPDEASANAAWGAAAKAMPFVGSLGKSVQAAQVDGRTVYRLRVNAGSAGQATELCRKIKATGAACFVPKA